MDVTEAGVIATQGGTALRNKRREFFKWLEPRAPAVTLVLGLLIYWAVWTPTPKVLAPQAPAPTLQGQRTPGANLGYTEEARFSTNQCTKAYPVMDGYCMDWSWRSSSAFGAEFIAEISNDAGATWQPASRGEQNAGKFMRFCAKLPVGEAVYLTITHREGVCVRSSGQQTPNVTSPRK